MHLQTKKPPFWMVFEVQLSYYSLYEFLQRSNYYRSYCKYSDNSDKCPNKLLLGFLTFSFLFRSCKSKSYIYCKQYCYQINNEHDGTKYCHYQVYHIGDFFRNARGRRSSFRK